MRWLERTAVAVVALFVGAAIGPVLRLDGSARADGGCGTGSLRGLYAMEGAGTLFGLPLASVGTVTFDGDGRLTGDHIDSAGGVINHSSLEGTYSIGADCRGTASFTHHHTQAAGGHSVDDPDDDHVFALAVADGGARVAWLLVETAPRGLPGQPGSPGPDVAVRGSFERS